MTDHVNYPHEPGRLHDCPACMERCYCTRNTTECVFEGSHRLFIDLCPDCVIVNAYGLEFLVDMGGVIPDPQPMNLIPSDYRVCEDYPDGMEPEAHFSKSPCDGCGNTAHGSRYTYVALPPNWRK